MIIGMFVRGYKAFNNLTYIPITKSEPFAAYIGDNGVGKSSALEALDWYFNERHSNRSEANKKQGSSTLQYDALVAPIFLVTDADLGGYSENNRRLIKAISKIAVEGTGKEPASKQFSTHLNEIDLDSKHLLVLTKYFSKNFENIVFPLRALNVSLYENRNTLDLEDKDFTSGNIHGLKGLPKLREAISNKTSYIYLPVEGQGSHFQNLQSKAFLDLADVELERVISAAIQSDNTDIAQQISEDLDIFLNAINKLIKPYQYTNLHRNRFTKRLLTEKILESYFSTKTLHQKAPRSVPFEYFSSGEKCQAILSLTRSLLSNNSSSKSIIIAIDEPEASLHFTRVFDQFECLVSLQAKAQILATTHWYGFLPIIQSGFVHSMNRVNGDLFIETFDLTDHRQEVRDLVTDMAGKSPLDTFLKAHSELIHAIVASVCLDDPIKWIICEGMTDKEYLKCFLHAYYETENTKIVAVAGAKNVLRIFRSLHPILEDIGDRVAGRVFCLIDTDDILPPRGSIPDSIPKKLYLKRLCNSPVDGFETQLLDTTSSTTGKTEIEDVLPVEPYKRVIKTLASEIGLSEVSWREDAPNSGQALDIKASEKEKLANYLTNCKGEGKVKFLKRYTNEFMKTPSEVEWVGKLAALLDLPKK